MFAYSCTPVLTRAAEMRSRNEPGRLARSGSGSGEQTVVREARDMARRLGLRRGRARGSMEN